MTGSDSSSIAEPTVLLTDRAWPDDSIEREVVEAAGFRLVSGPADPASAEVIEGLVDEHRPSAVLTCWAPVSAAAITRGSTEGPLRHVARMGVGLDNIAVDAASEAGRGASSSRTARCAVGSGTPPAPSCGGSPP